MGKLGWALAAIAAGLIVGSVVIKIIVEFLDLATAKQKLKENRIKSGWIKEIVESDGIPHIKLEALDEDDNIREVEFEVQQYDRGTIKEGLQIEV